MAVVPGRAQPTSNDMAESGEHDRRSIGDSLRSIAQSLVRKGNNWDQQMFHLQSQNEELRREMKDLKERYGHAAAPERTVRDQPTVEDITDPNRQSQIVQKYTQFIDEERMDAIEALDKEFPEEKRDNEKFVCEVFQVAFEIATGAINSVRQHLPNILVNPTSFHAASCEEVNEDERDIGLHLKYSTRPDLRAKLREKDVRNIMDGAISTYLKKTSDSVDTTAMEQNILPALKGKYQRGSWTRKQDKKLSLSHPYIPQCCRMAWQLVVQTPSMHIQYSETLYDPTKHRLRDKKSPASESTKICYLWPTLYNKLNGNVIYKGIVSATESRV